MFGVVIGAVVIVAFLGIAAKEALASTASKIKNGDSVFLPVSALVANEPGQQQSLSVFVQGFTNVSTKVSNVAIDPGHTDFGTGSIIGLTPLVRFPLSQVTKIERNGVQFT